MISKMVLPPESFIANITNIRSFVRVSPFVYEEVIAFCEMSARK